MFGYVGAGLQVFAGLMIAVSIPIAPPWLVGALVVFLVIAGAWSWRRFGSNFMMPTFVGTMAAVAWMVAIGVGVGVLGWSA